MKKTLLLFIAITTLVGCSKEKDIELTEEKKLTSIKFEDNKVKIPEGESLNVKIIHSPEDIPAPEYILSSEDKKIVEVDGTKITAIKVGETTITAIAKDTDLKASMKIIVEPISPETILISADESEIFVGETLQLKYTIEPPNTTDIEGKEVEWTSSDEKVAEVSPDGIVEGVAEGEVEIAAKIKGTSILGKYTVKINPIKVESVSIIEKDLSLISGETKQLSFKILPENATNQGVKWESSNPNVILVDDSGLITAKDEGTSIIKVITKDGEKESSITVKVTLPKVDRIVLNKTRIQLQVGETEKLIATVYPENSKDKTVTWSSSNEDIVKVDLNGNLKITGAGSAYVTAQSNSNPSIDAICLIEVPETSELIKTYISSSSGVNINGIYTGNVTGVIANLSIQDIKFISYQVKDYNNRVISQNNTEQTVAAGKQISFSSRLVSVDRPKVHFVFEIDGTRHERTVNL